MRKIILTTALVLPLSGLAFAQDSATTPDPAPVTAAETAADAARAAADNAAEAAGAAADAASEATETVTTDGPVPEAALPEATTEAAPDQAQILEAEMASSEKIAREQAMNELRVDWIIGASVTSHDGDSIGRVNDLIVDAQNGQMIAAIIGVGGFLGIGEKQVAVPWKQLTVNFDAQEIHTALTHDEATAAPDYVFRDRESAPPPAPVTPEPEAPAADPVADPAVTPDPAPAN
ncbi:MAG: PRC-barrel domain-containing protein [Paracoccus sp. (in: a-proteobacteria)]|nr:PRC-barrel domain-containing protein [Paracoccus sp. (in: a-proteobacteria)]